MARRAIVDSDHKLYRFGADNQERKGLTNTLIRRPFEPRPRGNFLSILIFFFALLSFLQQAAIGTTRWRVQACYYGQAPYAQYLCRHSKRPRVFALSSAQSISHRRPANKLCKPGHLHAVTRASLTAGISTCDQGTNPSTLQKGATIIRRSVWLHDLGCLASSSRNLQPSLMRCASPPQHPGATLTTRLRKRSHAWTAT